MNNFIKTLIYRMSHVTGTKLTDRHIQILEYAYNYYQKNKVGPLYQNLKKHINANRDEIEKLFPQGLNSVYSWVGIHIQSTYKLCKPVPFIEVDDFREVYLDHNATTYPHDKVIKILNQYNKNDRSFGNPSSSTFLGREAYEQINDARKKIARCLHVRSNNIVFVNGGSEANNLAIKGIAFQHLKNKGHIITSKIEHPSVLNPLKYLETLGFQVTYLDVDCDGVVSLQQLKNSLREDTILVSVMAANNEIGTIQPIAELGKICKQANVPFMVDAIQAFGRMKIHPGEMGISLLSVSGHKIYGPKGIGALYIDNNVKLVPLIHGGGQESGLRPGTENVGAINAFGESARLIYHDLENENSRIRKLRDYFLFNLKKISPGFIINGPLNNRIPHNLSIGFPGIDSGALLLTLNQIGIYVSSGSACSAGSKEDSHVLQAIGLNTRRYGTIRFSFGLKTTKDDLDYLFKYLPIILKRLTEMNTTR